MEFVEFGTAKLLKRAGFPQDCKTPFYDGYDGLLTSYEDECHGESFAAPAIYQAVAWLRDNFGLFIQVIPRFPLIKGELIRFETTVTTPDVNGPMGAHYIVDSWNPHFSPTKWSEAEELGIGYACDYIIINKVQNKKGGEK